MRYNPDILTHMLLAPALAAIMAGQAVAGGLPRDAAERFRDRLAASRIAGLKRERKPEIAARSISLGTHTLRWVESVHGNRGTKGWPLWISLHGGGEVPQILNNEQWQQQAELYKPESGIYLSPRAPTDTWDMWHQAHVDPLLERLMESLIAVRDVDPDRIYLIGYSAGGDGVYHLAPRLADRFAAAATMAGIPFGAPQLSLRNLPFAILVGEHDTTFGRVKEAELWNVKFGELRAGDPDGYRSFFRIYADCGHWMDGKDAEALPWMARFERNPWPKKIVWVQDEIVRPRFYWLEIPPSAAKPAAEIRATVTGQTISITGAPGPSLTLWLSDELLDLDLPVVIRINGTTVHNGTVSRSKEAIRASLSARPDHSACATAMLKLTF